MWGCSRAFVVFCHIDGAAYNTVLCSNILSELHSHKTHTQSPLAVSSSAVVVVAATVQYSTIE